MERSLYVRTFNHKRLGAEGIDADQPLRGPPRARSAWWSVARQRRYRLAIVFAEEADWIMRTADPLNRELQESVLGSSMCRAIVLAVHRFALRTLRRLQRVLAMPNQFFVEVSRLDHQAEEQF